MIANRSLRVTLLGTLGACSLATAILVGSGSWWWVGRTVSGEIGEAFSVLETTLAEAKYPLNPAVLQSVSGLAGCELAAYDESKSLLHTTLQGVPRQLPAMQAGTFDSGVVPGYLARRIARRGGTSVDAHWVLVLYDLRTLERAKWSSAALPLVTGIASTALLSVVLGVLSQRFISRITHLKNTVHRVAVGDFSVEEDFDEPDELGELGRAVTKMKVDLQRLWKTVQRQEREQLIHRMAAGLAHQLRNSLTGAKMAIDIVASKQRERNQSSEALEVAAREIQRTEGYVQRILTLSSKREMDSSPQSVHECLLPVRESLRLIAEHHRVKLDWDVNLQAKEIIVRDGAALASAIENLTLNALQAGGTEIRVVVNREESQKGTPLLCFEVCDNGPGPSGEAVDLFEPFYSTKPEGLGLGLALVKRAAENLGGNVAWKREQGWTLFTMKVPV